MIPVSENFSTMAGSAFRKVFFNLSVSWKKLLNETVSFFTVGTSTIGGPDILKADSITNPSFFDKFQYYDESKYLKSWSVTRKIGNYPFGVIMAQADVELDNTNKRFLPNNATGSDGYCLNFGSAGSVAVPFVDLGTTLSYETWFTLSALTSDMNLLSFMRSAIQVDTTKINWYADTWSAPVTHSVTLNQNQFYHLVITQSGTDYVIYLNGVAVKSGTGSAISNLNDSNKIGALGGDTDFRGKVDEFRIYSRALTADEVKDHFNDGIGKYGSAETGLEIGYHFDEASGSTAEDYSGNNRDGSITGATYANGTIITPNELGAYILPDRPFKIAMGFDGEGIPVFVGFSDAPETGIISRTAKLHGYDAIEYLNKKTSALSMFTDKSASYIIEQLLIEAGFDSTQYSLEASLQSNIAYFAPYGKSLGACITQLVEAEQGLFFVAENGTLTFWNRQHIPTNNTNRWTFTYSNSKDLKFTNAPVINDVIVRAKPRAIASKQKIFESSASVKIPAGSTFDYWIDFTDNDGEMPVTSVDTPVFASTDATSQYTTNIKSDNSGDSYNAYISIDSVYNFGSKYLVTFRNTFTSPIYITSLILHGTPAKVVTRIEERYKNDLSIEKYGRNPQNAGSPLVIENDAIQDDETAYSLCYMLVTDYSVPNRRLELPVFAVPHLQLGDWVTVNIEDTGESLSMVIAGDTLSSDDSTLLSQELLLEAKTITKYFTVGTSTIGGDDKIAP